jgi:hypothetical protein
MKQINNAQFKSLLGYDMLNRLQGMKLVTRRELKVGDVVYNTWKNNT